jgi:SAM-dependent methyltransferase
VSAARGRGSHEQRPTESGKGDEIAEFYDHHPYPPPMRDLDAELAGWSDGTRRRIEHARVWPTSAYRDDHEILVAGCGTSQAARYAARYPRAHVTGIDVSPASLHATRRLVERHDLTNLELHELPIEEVASLGRSFDYVVCTGVLHHLADPATGLRALREALAPAGALRLMVYATYGRYGVHLIQNYCRRLGIAPTPGEIADLVDTLRELPTGHPLSHALRDTPDFRDDDALADALLNPRDRSYTVPELLDLVDTAGLRFERWVHQAPYRPHCGALTETPHGHRIAAMAPRDQFAAVELFRGTMQRHSAIVYRDDSTLTPLDWDDWRSFVPITPDTVISVEERLPANVAAVLINQAHVDRDLVMFVSASEKQVFEQIDGRTTLGAISGASLEFVRNLWWHDLAVIAAA